MLVGRPGLSPVMVGRAAELDRLAALADSATRPAVAIVGGEAGIGKTRLVRELLDRLPPDVRVLAGQADPGALGRPFEVFLDAVRALDPDDPHHKAVADRNRPNDERIASAVDLIADLAPKQPRARVASSEGEPGGGGIAVVFDDLHWADSESVQLFERLAEPGSGPALLIGTYRPDAISRRHPVADLLPRLERRLGITHIHLDRLSPSDVTSFLAAVYGRAPSYRVIEALHARTGGNPFFLEELLAAAGEADPEQLIAQPLPWNLSELMRSQLEGLSKEERCVLETAAVLGRRVSFDLLAEVSGYPEDELIPILRALVAAGLLVESENDVFAFRHALAREAIEVDLLGRERRRLHERALETLKASGSTDMAAMAHHANGAGRIADMVAAAKEGGLAKKEQGSTYQALQLAEMGLAEAPDDLELLSLASWAAWLCGLIEDALVHAEHRLEVARHEGSIVHEASALRRIMRLQWERGDIVSMERVNEELISLLPRLPLPDQGHSMAAIAQGYMLRDQYPEAIDFADRAIALGEEIGDECIKVWAEAEKGSALVALPELSELGAEMLSKAADDAERLGEWVIVARALNNRRHTASSRANPEEARRSLTRMRKAAERAGFDSLSGAGYWQGLADQAEWEGDLLGAREHLAEGRRRDRGTISHHASWFGLHEAGLALEANDLEAAESVAAEMSASLRAVGVPGYGCKAVNWRGLLVHLALRRGDLAEFREQLQALISTIEASRGTDQSLVHDIVSAALRAGVSAAEVRPLVEPSLPPLAWQPYCAEAYTVLIEGQLAEAEGRYEEAVELYESAIKASEDVLWPAVRATAAIGAARSYIALGRLDEARESATFAALLLERWGGWRVEELCAVERRLGLVGGPQGADGLTPREREVVALLAEGLSNADLAARLFISPKTAAVHVSNILAKLGMSSRAEVAAWAVREGTA